MILVPAPSALHDLPDKLAVNLVIDDRLHHSKVLQVVVCLEQGITGVEFDKNTPDTPDVTWETPAQVQDNLRRSIMSGGHHR